MRSRSLWPLAAAFAALLLPFGAGTLRAHGDDVLRGRAELVPPDGPAPPSPEGRIDAESRPADAGHAASSRLRIRLSHLAGGAEHTLWSDDPATAETTLVQFAVVTTNGGGSAVLDLSSRQGDPMPFGALLADLAGLPVEVRDGASAVVLAGEFPAPADPRPREPALRGKSDLTREPGSPFANAAGRVDERVQPADADDPEQSRLAIDVRGLAAHAQYTLWSDDPATAETTLVEFASLTTGDDGRARFRVDTRRGDTLPFGATLDALGGAPLEVRDADDAVVLSGEFPTPAAPPRRAPVLRGRSELLPPGGPTPPSPEGRIDEEIRSADAGHAASSRVRIRVRHLAPDAEHTFWSDDPATAETTLVQFAAATTNGRGDAKVEFDSRDGDPMPFGATLEDLAEAPVEVRDAGGVVVLVGEFPTPEAPLRRPPPLRGVADLTRPVVSPFPESMGRIRVEIRPAFGDDPETSSLTIELARLRGDASYTLWSDDPATADASLVEFASLTTGDEGRARFRADTRKGGVLPFGASLPELAGLPVEVRDADGEAVLSGEFPTPQ